MSALDTRIDDLYRQPLKDFTSARNALAKSLAGADAKRVRALTKPTIVPWAVNQVYWCARHAYDRLMKSGEQLRKAQIAALEGRSADVRAASEAHRRAIADAVAEAERLAAPAGSKPGPDALARTFEALSLAPGPPEAPGRMTDALQPAGFEALAALPNLKLKPRSAEPRTPHAERRTPQAEPPTTPAARRKAMAEAGRAASARKKRDAELKSADAAVARAEAAERLARASWERAHDELLGARRKLTDLKKSEV